MKILAALLSALFLANLASAKDVVDRPALWKLSDPDTTVWLFGTVHMLPPGHNWFQGKVADAFAGAGELAMETRIPDPALVQEVIQRRALYTDGTKLADRLTPALSTRLDARLKEFGIPAEPLQRVEPWYMAMTLELMAYQRLGLTSTTGVESRLISEAGQQDKPIEGLETFDQQIGYFDDLPERLQLQMLEATLDETSDASKLIGKLVKSWSKGDIGGVASLTNDNVDRLPELRSVFLERRNARWADWVDARMKRPGTVFVAVGAGHLGGRNNLRQLLARKGYKVVRVQ